MKTILALAIVIASLTSCAISIKPDGSYEATVDPIAATTWAGNVLTDK